MNRKSRVSCVLLACVHAVFFTAVPLASAHQAVDRLIDSDIPVAYQFGKTTPDHDLPGLPVLTAKRIRTPGSGSWERSRERSSDHGIFRDLLHQAPINPGFASKLDQCSEYTKPDSLVIRSMGTPKNHRSPPA